MFWTNMIFAFTEHYTNLHTIQNESEVFISVFVEHLKSYHIATPHVNHYVKIYFTKVAGGYAIEYVYHNPYSNFCKVFYFPDSKIFLRMCKFGLVLFTL